MRTYASIQVHYHTHSLPLSASPSRPFSLSLLPSPTPLPPSLSPFLPPSLPPFLSRVNFSAFDRRRPPQLWSPAAEIAPLAHGPAKARRCAARIGARAGPGLQLGQAELSRPLDAPPQQLPLQLPLPRRPHQTHLRRRHAPRIPPGATAVTRGRLAAAAVESAAGWLGRGCRADTPRHPEFLDCGK